MINDVGTVVAFTHKENIPTNYLLCDGREVSRSTYSMLFAVIGESFGSGDGVNTFNLPDLRGVFLRGLDLGSGKDVDSASRTALQEGGNTGDNIGSYQADSLAEHNHPILMNVDYGDAESSLCSQVRSMEPGHPWAYTGNNDGASSDTRPKNVGVVYIIKFLPDSSLVASNIRCYSTVTSFSQSFNSNVNTSVRLSDGLVEDPYNMIDTFSGVRVSFPLSGIYKISASTNVIGYSSNNQKESGLSIINSNTGIPIIQIAPCASPSLNSLVLRFPQNTAIEFTVCPPTGYTELQFFSIAIEMIKQEE
jgi:microcystin-dependent protein